ncbi:thioredoxin domain-containing protein 11 [Anolis carolinensis]|nr:PREDICTED: thioredoxin domain-containing protein 11 [Anolis carolinensis]|eukprot:XP_008120633.1 PREDICTED: thioredoxin domain-containing protein 11 [Anolis carolinensis]
MSSCGGPGSDPTEGPPAPAAAPPGRLSRMARLQRRRPAVLFGGAAAAVLGCAFLAALKASSSRAKDVTLPARPPVSFFALTSPVHDLFLGQLDHAEDIRRDSDVSLFYFYAPWCGQSVAVREEIEKVAGILADQVLFVAINCWWNQGKCRKQKQFFYFPVIYLYHQSFGPIEYKGPMNAVYIEKFVRRVMTPLHYISSQSKLQRFLSHYEPGVLGYFEFNTSPQPPGYLTFFTSALHSLNKDHLGPIHFGVITNKQVAKEIPLTVSGSIYLPRRLNASLLFPHEVMNYTAENVWKWALENGESLVRWLRPHGGKSLLLSNELKKGPALFLFLPFDPLAEHQPLVEEVSELALEYNRCNKSRRTEEAGHPDGAWAPLPRSASRPRCCNTVVLPPRWHSLSRASAYNICELCVNQSDGLHPSPLATCTFFEIEAALDSFYLQERAFLFHTASLCSNFLHSYSPFSYYSACCRTVGSGEASQWPLGGAAPHGTPPRPWGDRAHPSMPHIEDGKGLLPASPPFFRPGFTGLSCRTNKTLNLYLLDANLFWAYAERLGASAPTKGFAAIVDLKEETHYVLDQEQALRGASLETFIQNYSVVYSPLRRHLVGERRTGRPKALHRIREITSGTFQETVLKSPQDVVLLYYTPWCGFCMSLNHVFLQLARILPPQDFLVARVDVSRNDLPWEFMTDHLPNVLFFPQGRKDRSVRFPSWHFPLTLPNLLRFLLAHSGRPSSSSSSSSSSSDPEPSLKGSLLGGLLAENAFLKALLTTKQRSEDEGPFSPIDPFPKAEEGGQAQPDLCSRETEGE